MVKLLMITIFIGFTSSGCYATYEVTAENKEQKTKEITTASLDNHADIRLTDDRIEKGSTLIFTPDSLYWYDTETLDKSGVRVDHINSIRFTDTWKGARRGFIAGGGLGIIGAALFTASLEYSTVSGIGPFMFIASAPHGLLAGGALGLLFGTFQGHETTYDLRITPETGE